MFSISYLIVTKNRLPFIKIIMDELLSQLKEDEEVVVVDGDSTDGAKEYLQGLYDQGKIHQFLSEPDHNQAHGWNKAIFMSRGVILKKVIDDDVHDYATIRRCRDFMMQHPDVDAVISNCLMSDISDPEKIELASRLPWYKKWKAGEINTFTFSDVYMLIRRSSINYIGLFDTQIKMIDWEYTLRMTFLKVNIAYYTGCIALAASTPGNVSSSLSKTAGKFEAAVGKIKYGYIGDRYGISFYSEVKIALGKFIATFKPKTQVQLRNEAGIPSEAELKNYYSEYYKLLKEYNVSGGDWGFIY